MTGALLPRLHCFSVLESTSSLAAELARQGAEHGTVVCADCQTSGRGRGSRTFFSPPGGLYFSMILRPELDASEFPLLALAAGVGISLGISRAADVQAQLKWPNDLHAAGRKLGGILSESGPLRAGQPEFAVVGVGVNVAVPDQGFPPELRGKVVALAEAAGRQVGSPRDLLPLLADELLAAACRLERDKASLLAEWRLLDCLLGKPLNYAAPDELVPAIGAGLADDGRYVIIDRHGREHRLAAGELSLIRAALQGNS